MIKQLLFTFTLLTQVLLAQNFGSMRFTNYADDRKSAFSLTFDDGLLTHTENAAPILNQYGFKGTFYVIPPYLTESLPGIWRYGTWPDFQVLANQGHEIGSHTMRHYDLTSLQWGSIDDDSTLLYELYQSQYFIEQKIPNQKCISLNYPYTYHNVIVDSAASLFYENARTLGQVANDSLLSENDWYSLKAKVVEFDLPRNSVEDDLDELFTFLDWTQNSITNHKWGMIIIHYVIPFSDLDSLINDIYEPVTNEWLTSLCDFLWARSSTKNVWVETVGNITRYIKERDAASYEIISSSSQLVEINVTDDLENEIYNYPLSAYVKIPESWNYVRFEQNGIIDTLGITFSDSGKVVLVNVIPDKGVLKLSPVTSTDVENEIVSVSEFKLDQNYPNPFNPSTTIKFTIPNVSINKIEGSRVQLKVFDILGNEVASLVDEFKPAGINEVNFNGSKFSSGIYYYQLKVGKYFETKKMILLK